MDKNNLTKAVIGFQNGDSNAFNTIYEMTNESLYVYARSLMGDQAKAEDLLQNTYLQILQNINKLRDPGAFLSWSKRIMHNQYADQFRGYGGETTATSEEALLMFDEMVEEDRSAIPEENYDAQEVAGIVWDVMDQLPPDQRTVMLAFYRDEMSIADIANMLDIPEGTVKTRLYYGRKAVRRDIENYENKHGIKLHSLVPGPIISMALKHHLPADMVMSHGQAASVFSRIAESAVGQATKAGTAGAASTASQGTKAAASAASHGAKAAAGAKAAGIAGTGIGKLIAIAVAAGIAIGGAGYGVYHAVSNAPQNDVQDNVSEESTAEAEEQVADETQWTELADDDYTSLIEGGLAKEDTAHALALTTLYCQEYEKYDGFSREMLENQLGPGNMDVFMAGLLCPGVTFEQRTDNLVVTIPLAEINRYRGFWGLEPYEENKEYIAGVKWSDSNNLYMAAYFDGMYGDPEAMISKGEMRGDDMQIEFSFAANAPSGNGYEMVDFGPYVANFRKNAKGYYALYDVVPKE